MNDEYYGCINCLSYAETKEEFIRNSCRSFGDSCKDLVPEYISRQQEYEYIKLKVKQYDKK